MATLSWSDMSEEEYLEIRLKEAGLSDDRVTEFAEKHGVPRSQIALARVLQKQPKRE